MITSQQAVPPAAVTVLEGAPTGDPRATTRRLALVATGTLLYFVIVAGSSTLAVLGLVLVAVLVVAANTAWPAFTDPTELAVTAQLSVLVAFPFAHLPHDRLTSYSFVLFSVAVTGSALVRQPLTQAPPGWTLVLGLFTVLGVSSAVSPDVGAVKQLVVIAAAGLPLYLLTARNDRDRIRAVSAVLICLAAAESVLAVLEPFLFPRHLWSSAPAETGSVHLANTLLSGVERSQGTLGQPLPLGLLLVLAIAMLVRVRTDIAWARRGALVALLLVGLVFTGDRNALLTALLVLVWGTRLSAVRSLAGAAGLVLLIGLVVDAGAVTSAVLDRFLHSGSYVHRLLAYGSLGKLAYTQGVGHVLFGNGFASTPRMFADGRLQDDGFHVVDNQFILMQSQGGVLSLLLLLSILVFALIRCRHPLRMAVVATFVVMLIFDVLLWPSATALTFVVLGFALSSGHQAAIQLWPSSRRGR